MSTAAPPARQRSGPGAAAQRRLQANLLAIHGHFDELNALDDEERLEAELPSALKASQPSAADTGDAGQPLPAEARARMETELRIPLDVPIAARTERRSRAARDRPQAAEAPDMVPEGSGQPIPASVRAPFEAAMGRSFADVRIHTGAAAAQAVAALDANAFAVESDIYFGAGQYAPGMPHGDRVLAHELVHIGQRQDGRMPGGGGVSAHDDPLEREAYGAEQEIAQIAQETRGGPNAADSGYSIEQTHSARSDSSPIHRESAAGEGRGAGPTVPEQSDEEIFGQADAVVDEEISIEEAGEGGEAGEAGGETGSAAAGSSTESAEGGGEAPAGPVVEATDGPGPAAVTPIVLAPIQVELPAVQPAQTAPSASQAAPAGEVAGTGALTGSARSAGASLHADVALAAAGVEGAITAHAAALSAQVQASIGSARRAIDGAFDAQIQAITAAAADVQAQMAAAMADCIAQLEAGHAAQVAVAEGDRAARHADADARVEATRQRMNAMGLREAARARDGSEQRARQALALAQASASGAAACADAQRQAAERIATKTAEAIRAKGDSLAEGAVQAAGDASTQLDGSADKYHAEIDSSYDGVVEQLGQVFAATVGAVREQSTGPTEQAGKVERAAIEQLEGQRQAAHGDLDALATHVLGTIDAGATGLAESLGAQVDELLAEVDAEIAAAGAALATVTDAAAAQALATQINASAQQAGSEIRATLAERADCLARRVGRSTRAVRFHGDEPRRGRRGRR